LDWSSYDAYIPAWLLETAFDLIEDHLDFSHRTIRGEPRYVVEECQKNVWRWVKQ